MEGKTKTVILTLSLLSLLFVFLLHFGWTRTVYQYDGMSYTTSGFLISQGRGREIPEFAIRSPLIPYFLSFLFYFFPIPPSLLGMHILSTIFLLLSFFFLFISYFLFRSQGLSLSWACLGVLLLAANRFFLHYSTETMTDIPAALFVLFAYLTYQQYLKTRKKIFLVSVSLFLATTFATRQILATVSIFFFAYHLFFQSRKLPFSTLLLELSFLSLLPCLLGFVAYGTIPLAFGQPFDILFFLRVQIPRYSQVEKVFTYPTDTFWEGIIYLLEGGGLAITALYFLAIWQLFSQKRWKNFPLWFSLFGLLVLPLIWRHWEGRYFFYTFPFVYFLALSSLSHLTQKYSPKWIFPPVLLLTFFPFVKEILCLREPLYRDPLPLKVSLRIRELIPLDTGRPFFYARQFFPIFPKGYPKWYHMTTYDEFYHFFHHTWYTFSFYSGGRKGATIPGELFLTYFPIIHLQGVPYPHWKLFLLNPLRFLKKGDVVLYGPPAASLSFLPLGHSFPLLLTQLEQETLKKQKDKFVSPHFLFVKEQSTWRIQKAPSYPFDLYLFFQGERKWLGTVISPSEIILPSQEKQSISTFFSLLPSQGQFQVSWWKIEKYYQGTHF